MAGSTLIIDPATFPGGDLDASNDKKHRGKKVKGGKSKGSGSKRSCNDSITAPTSSVSSDSGGPSQRKGFLHNVASMFKRNGGIVAAARKHETKLEKTKDKLLAELTKAEGDVTGKAFKAALDKLVELYDPTHFDARMKTSKREDLKSHLGGHWATLSKPTYKDCLGPNANGDPMYHLGRMSFDMFRPGNLVISIQCIFNPVHTVSRKDRQAIKYVPKNLVKDVKEGTSVLRSYDIVSAFTVEDKSCTDDPNSPNRHVKKPIKALMTMEGYVLADPDVPHRLKTWFTGGRIEVDDEKQDMEAWKEVFDRIGRLELQEHARRLAAWLAMGADPANEMDEDGKMEFHFKRPMDGCYVELLYMDESLRIMRASSGTVFVFSRVPESSSQVVAQHSSVAPGAA